MENEWLSRTDLNWCPYCWFNCNFESKLHPILGCKILCKGCGSTFSDGDEFGPKFFSDIEWDEYWNKNFKQQ